MASAAAREILAQRVRLRYHCPMSGYDSARAWGELIGSIVAPFLLGAVIYGIGAWVTSRRAEAAQRATRRGFLAASIAVTVLGLVASAANLARRSGGDADDERIAGFFRGIGTGCSKRCIADKFTEAQCGDFCGCVADEMRRRLPRADALRLARAGTADPQRDPAAAHFIASAQACRSRYPARR